jgi:transposase
VSVNDLASISNQGKLRFLLSTQKLTAQVFIIFLERLMAKRERKRMWIVDRHPVHRSDALRQWLQEHQDKIEMHFLPSYAPELNPAEYRHCDVKPGGLLSPRTRPLSQLKGRF